MDTRIDLDKIHESIQKMKSVAEELNRMGENFPALEKNTARILASINMLEKNLSDMMDL